MHQPGRCRIREMPDHTDDPAPARFAGGVAVRCKLIGPSGALLLGRLAVPPEHQVGGAPDVDLGHHAEKASRRPPTKRLPGAGGAVASGAHQRVSKPLNAWGMCRMSVSSSLCSPDGVSAGKFISIESARPPNR